MYWSEFPSHDRGEQTRDRTFTLADGRTLELRFTASSILLPSGAAAHDLGVNRRWENPTSTFTAPVTIVSSSGNFRQDELLNVEITTQTSNPWAHRTDGKGAIHYKVGASYKVTSSTTYGGSLSLANNGNLIIYAAGSTIVWQSYSGRTPEPLVATGTVNPLDDVCGKRVSSCKVRFGQYAELPNGS